jgi:hypothetical protein
LRTRGRAEHHSIWRHTQQLTVRDPISIVRAKASIAAAVNLEIALARRSGWPSGGVVAATLALGAVS